MTTSPLKWPGGKQQLLDELRKRLPTSATQNYHEPFIGGGAVFFDICPENGSINDTNTRLVNFYTVVRDKPEQLISRCEEFDHPASDPDPSLSFSETDQKDREISEYYYQQRARFNKRAYGEPLEPVEEAAVMLYLNRTCYNGLYRENLSGEFNTSKGDYDNPNYVRRDAVRTSSETLEGISLYNKDFSYVLDVAEAGDVVYFDPPYKPVSETSDFTQYSADGFEQEDQLRLLDVVQELVEMEVSVIISNSAVMKDLYEEHGLTVDLVDANRVINSDETKRGSVKEVIATNIHPDHDTKLQSQLHSF